MTALSSDLGSLCPSGVITVAIGLLYPPSPASPLLCGNDPHLLPRWGVGDPAGSTRGLILRGCVWKIMMSRAYEDEGWEAAMVGAGSGFDPPLQQRNPNDISSDLSASLANPGIVGIRSLVESGVKEGIGVGVQVF